MITAAADGSSLSNPGPAGWAWYVDETCWAAGGWAHGTNNMGELMAVLDLLRQTAHVDEPLHVLCDSQYAINTCTTWIKGWKRRGWKKADGKPILNLPLVQALDAALAGREITFEWVKGHAGHALNEAADQRARAAATAFRDGGCVDAGPGFTGATPAGSLDVAPSVREEPPSLFDDPGESDEEVCWRHEQALLTDVVRRTWRLASALLHPAFFGFCSSGADITRDTLEQDLAPLDEPVKPELLGTTRLGPDAILLWWRSHRADGTTTNCSSVWVRHEGGWKLRFHQGTHRA